MQRVAYAMGQQRRQQVCYGTTASGEVMDEEEPVKEGEIMESSNTANNARTYCFEECCAPRPMDLCVESAATEVTMSTKISRSGWTDEERSVGHVLVGGDGSTTSQLAMEVEGKSVGDEGSYMEVENNVNSSESNKKGIDRKKKKKVNIV
jgi:hypothetical protein